MFLLCSRGWFAAVRGNLFSKGFIIKYRLRHLNGQIFSMLYMTMSPFSGLSTALDNFIDFLLLFILRFSSAFLLIFFFFLRRSSPFVAFSPQRPRLFLIPCRAWNRRNLILFWDSEVGWHEWTEILWTDTITFPLSSVPVCARVCVLQYMEEIIARNGEGAHFMAYLCYKSDYWCMNQCEAIQIHPVCFISATEA